MPDHIPSTGSWSTRRFAAEYGEPLLAVAIMLLVELLHNTPARIGNPGVLFIIVFVWAAFVGGTRPAVISAVLGFAFVLYYFSLPGALFEYSPDNRNRIALLIFAFPAIILVVGTLKRRSETAMLYSQALNRINAEIISTLDFDEIMRRVVKEAREVLGAGTAYVTLRESGEWVLKYLSGETAAPVGARFSDAEAPVDALTEKISQVDVIDDAYVDERFDRKVMERYGVRSYLTAPLWLKAKFIGILGFTDKKTSAFSRPQADFISKVAASVSLALENAGLYEAEVEAQKQAKEELAISNLLLETADTLAVSLELQQVLEALADAVLQATKRMRIFIAMIDEKAAAATFKVSRGQPGLPVGTSTKLSEASPKAQQALRDKKAQLLDYDAPDASKADKDRAGKFNSRLALFVPLVAEDKVIGFINADDPGERRIFSPREIDLVEAIAAQAAVAIERARLYERQRETARLNAALTQIDAVIHSTLEIEQVMKEVLDEAVQAIGSEVGGINLRKEDHWERVALYGLPKKFLGERLTDEQNKVATLVAKTIRPVIIDDASTDERIDQWFVAKYGIKSAMAFPISTRNKVVGVIFFNYHSVPTRFTEGQINFAVKLAGSLALALENARLYAEERDSKRLGDALNEINRTLTLSLEPGEILREVVESAAKAFGSESATIALREDDQWIVKYTYGLPTKLQGVRITGGEAGPTLVAAADGKPLVINDAQEDTRISAELVAEFRLASLVAVPLKLKEEIFGGVAFIYRSAPRTFSDTQVDFAVKLAASVSLALENARLFEQQRRIADTLQESLIKMPEEISGLEFGHRYHSASEAARVGGDFYDIFEIEHGHVGILIGDVSGKGLEAAGLTSLVKSTIKAFTDQKLTPGLILTQTNDILRKRAGHFFVTIFYGQLTLQKGVLLFANAGHPPPIIRLRSDQARLLNDRPALPLGVIAGQRYEDQSCPLKKGDTLTLYTDGVTEARQNGRLFGEDRLLKLVGEAKDKGAKELPEMIFERVTDFAGGRFVDDVAVISISPRS